MSILYCHQDNYNLHVYDQNFSGLFEHTYKQCRAFRVYQESKYQKNIVKLLALALTNLVLGLANMVNNLVKPSLGQPHHQPDQNLALILTTLGPGVDTIIKQATTPPPPPHHQ